MLLPPWREGKGPGSSGVMHCVLRDRPVSCLTLRHATSKAARTSCCEARGADLDLDPCVLWGVTQGLLGS